MPVRSSAIALAGACALAVAACGGDPSPSDPAGTTSSTNGSTTSSTESSAAPSSATTTDGHTTTADGCKKGGEPVPPGAGTGTVPDVDDDGRRDQAWVAVADGATTVGIRTAAGGGDIREWDSASPVTRQILVVDVDDEPPVEILASDGRSVELWAFSDCRIQPVTNPQGDTYTFSLGFTDVGTGVGCVDIDGQRHLVGLDVRSDDGTTVTWARTVVLLDDTAARNGETATGTFRRPEEAGAIELLHQVTCGERTMAADGITVRQ